MITNILKWFGWLLAIVFFLILIFQKACTKPVEPNTSYIHDTVTIKGDRKLVLVQDTAFKPERTVYRYMNTIPNIDTASILKEYFASRVYMDTIKTRDVLAVIKDSISDNKLVGRKVFLENSRDIHESVLSLKPVTKLFLGGFLGLSQTSFKPALGLSIALITTKETLYFYHFDAIAMSHQLGMSWKLKFKN